MSFEQPPNQEQDKRRDFETLFETVLKNKKEDIPTIEYNLSYPKEEFLKFLTENKNVLLHGSANQSLEVLEPRQANDAAKKSGNKNAVYGVTDPVLPIFYAIQDRKKLQGNIESGVEINDDTGESKYKFKIPTSAKETQPWANGVIYIFDKRQFHPEQDDSGEPSGEWTSDVPVKPIAKLEVKPEDFRYMNNIEYN